MHCPLMPRGSVLACPRWMSGELFLAADSQASPPRESQPSTELPVGFRERTGCRVMG